MKRTLLLLLLSLPSLAILAQQPPQAPKKDPDADIRIDVPVSIADPSKRASADSNKIYTTLIKDPEFPGGMAKFADYLRTNLRYPTKARNNGLQGKVFLNFTIERDGSLSGIKVIRGIGSGCDEEAVRLLKEGPKWNPGIQNGHQVRVYYTLPIAFEL